MPSKMATCCREKAVLVRVYVERPRKRRLLSHTNTEQHYHHHHHHHHHHLHLNQPKKGNSSNSSRGGYNRKAELLNYSRRLRESARSVEPSPHHPNPTSSSNHQPIIQTTSVKSQPKHARRPTCLGILIPSFLRSLAISQTGQERKKNKKNSESTATKAKAIMKSFQIQKKGGFISKVLATVQKYR